ncbi:nuclease-related domain-containing protein [Aerococcaceae bacterium WGS1372]
MKKNHELIQLEICQRRGIELDYEANKRLINLRKGFEGEYTVFEWFQKFSHGQINIVTDYWFYHGKYMQVDLLVLLSNRWIVVEVKNYFGKFEYRHHECYLNGKLMSDNHINQLAHRTKRIQHIANELNSSIKIESIMVFIDEHCEVDIQSDIPMKVIQRNQLRAYISSLVNEQRNESQVISLNKMLNHLEKYRAESPFQPMLFEPCHLENRIRNGISCFNCHSFDTTVAKKLVSCRQCGYKAYKKQVVINAALELRYIYYYDTSKITNAAIFEYCGGLISSRTISSAMSSHFMLVSKGTRSYYDVPLKYIE